MDIESYFKKQNDITNNLPLKVIRKAKKIIERTISYNKNILCIGHGGSLLNVQHFCQDYLKYQFVNYNKRAKIMALGSNPGLFSAAFNDLEKEDAFIPEIFAISNPGDLLIAVSVSGTSKAIIKAVEWANQNELYTISLSGNKNINKGIANISDLSIIIPNDEFSFVEDLCMSIFHYIIYN